MCFQTEAPWLCKRKKSTSQCCVIVSFSRPAGQGRFQGPVEAAGCRLQSDEGYSNGSGWGHTHWELQNPQGEDGMSPEGLDWLHNSDGKRMKQKKGKVLKNFYCHIGWSDSVLSQTSGDSKTQSSQESSFTGSTPATQPLLWQSQTIKWLIHPITILKFEKHIHIQKAISNYSFFFTHLMTNSTCKMSENGTQFLKNLLFPLKTLPSFYWDK